MFSQQFPVKPVEMRVTVLPEGAPSCPPPPVLRDNDHLVTLVADQDNCAVCDTRAGFAAVWLTPAAVADRPYLRHHFLDAVGFLLVDLRYLAPVHGACVVRNGRGVLLCGESGAGKSSLAYACARHGWTYVSDDASYLIRGRKDHVVIGTPHRIRFRDDAGELFHELRDRPVFLRGNGKMTIEVPTAELGGVATAREATVHSIVFLNRSNTPGSAHIAAFPVEEAFRKLEQVIYCGEPIVRDARKSALRDLLTLGPLELTYSDPITAVQVLEELVSR